MQPLNFIFCECIHKYKYFPVIQRNVTDCTAVCDGFADSSLVLFRLAFCDAAICIFIAPNTPAPIPFQSSQFRAQFQKHMQRGNQIHAQIRRIHIIGK